MSERIVLRATITWEFSVERDGFFGQYSPEEVATMADEQGARFLFDGYDGESGEVHVEVVEQGGEMMELITEIRPYDGIARLSREAGFTIVTTEQEITLAIDDEASCCEEWGYFLTEDDTSKFIGAELRGIRTTDVNRSSREFVTDWHRDYEDAKHVYLDAGEVMFVDIETNRGVLQFVAYNAHNGYYGHVARVSSKQITYERTL